MNSILTIGFLYLIYNVYNHYPIYLLYISRCIGYINIYKRKLLKKIGNSKNIYFTIYDITINNGHTFILNKENNDNKLEYLKKNEKCYNSVEVYYHFNNKKYFIIYSNLNSIQNIHLLQNMKKNENAFQTTSDSIIFLELEHVNKEYSDETKEQILNIIKQYSGPNGIFYKNIDYNIDKHILIDILNKKLHLDLDYGIDFSILYSNGDQFIL